MDPWEGIDLHSSEVFSNKNLRVLYICSWFKRGDGLSSALTHQVLSPDSPNDYTIVALRVWEHDPGINVREYNRKRLRNLLKTEFDLIHYYLGSPSKILNHVVDDMKAVGVRLPILCTVCQSPSYKSFLISPYELSHVDHFVFIDKTAYYNPLINFIPDTHKSQIYLSKPGRLDRLTESMPIKQPEIGKVIFGRGTTLGKCPRNLFDVWDKIKVPGKKLHIAGVPKDGNWVQIEAEKRKDVVFHGFLPFDKWLEVCNSWDIVLYHIPKDSYASLDNNLGLGMLLRKPTVYLGVGAGKERFVHGENGFIANTEDELIEYSEKLASDVDLRLRIGLNARQSTVDLMKNARRDEKYDYIYRKLLNTSEEDNIKVPIWYKRYFLQKSWRRIIKSWLGIRNKKDLYFWRSKLPDA